MNQPDVVVAPAATASVLSPQRDTMDAVTRADFETPLVGRAPEVRALTAALERAGRSQPGVV
ncbi:MAG: hypothetical protein ACRDVO_16125, partial [Jiangellaceae bacterium]